MNFAVKQIQGEDDYAGSDNDDDAESSNDEDNNNKNFLDASKKFGVKALKTSAKKREDARQTGKQIDTEKVLKAARRVTGAAAASSDDD